MRADEHVTLVQYHIEKAQRALNDARSLMDCAGSPEGIVNRSYYAMFYAVTALLQGYEQIPREHSGVIGLFDSEFYKKGLFQKDFSKSLHKAFELRQKSDYREMVVIGRDEASESYENARQFVDAASQYLRRFQTGDSPKGTSGTPS